MSKYNLEDLLNEYIGGGRIGTLKISFKDLQDKMDELEDSGKVIVRTLSGPSGDGKVNREFEVVDRDSAVAGGNKQERGFTVYDYKFGFDPGSEEHFMEEYPFSVGGNDLKLAMELIDGVQSYGIGEEKEDKKELPDSIKKAEQDQIEKDARKARGDIKEGDLFSSKFDRQELKAIINDLNEEPIFDMAVRRAYKFLVSLLDNEDKREMGLNESIPALEKMDTMKREIRMQLDSFDKGIIDGDDLANAMEEIVFGDIKAPGMREGHAMSDNEADLEAGVKGNMDAFTEEVDVDLVKQTVARANNQIVTPGDLAEFILDVIKQVAEKEQDSILNNNNIKQAMVLLDKAKNATGKKPVEENGHVDNYADEIEEGISKDDIKKALKGTKVEIETYMDSLKRSGDKFDSIEDYVEDFENYVADKALQEHFSRFMFKKYS